MEKELPKNWVKVFLYDAIEPVKTGVNNYTNEKEYFSTGSVNDNRLVIEGLYNFKERPSRANREVKLGDVLQARMSDTNKAVIVNKEIKNALFSTGFMQFRVYGNTINPRYLFHYVKSDIFLNQKNEFASGTTQVAINDLNAKKITFLLPPLSEQNRIVEKLDRLFGQLEVIKTSMEKIPVLLKNFRQQVLTQAVTGKLTEEWREGKELEEWKETSIGNLFDVQTGSTPKRGEKKYYENASIPWIKSGQVKNELIFQSDEFITEIAVKETNSKIYPIDTILVAMYGEGKTRGQVGWTKIEATSNQAIAALVNNALDHITKKYVYNFCLSQYNEIRAQAEGGNQPNLNLSKIKNWKLNLPPFKEQQQIVSRVESLFSKADAIEEKYKNLKAKIETLPQTILHKAFKGELSEQLETDGNAKDLLEEIAALKNGEKPKKVVSKKYVQPDDEVLRIVAEADTKEYSTPMEKTAAWYDQRFELYVSKQGLAARGNLDRATLREIFDAMDDEDK